MLESWRTVPCTESDLGFWIKETYQTITTQLQEHLTKPFASVEFRPTEFCCTCLFLRGTTVVYEAKTSSHTDFMVLRLHILGAGNQKRHYTYVPWMRERFSEQWLMLGIPKVCMSFHHKCHNPVFPWRRWFPFPWPLRRETWRMALWSVSWIHAPKTRMVCPQHGWGLWLRVHGSMVVYPFKESPLIQKFGRNLISCQISSEKNRRTSISLLLLAIQKPGCSWQFLVLGDTWQSQRSVDEKFAGLGVGGSHLEATQWTRCVSTSTRRCYWWTHGSVVYNDSTGTREGWRKVQNTTPEK